MLVEAEEARARWRLAGDVATSVEFRPGTLLREFEVNQGVKCESQ